MLNCKKIFLISIIYSYFLTINCFAITNLSPRILIPSAPKLTASSYLLMDYDGGRILASKELAESVEPASLTKMMTMYVVDHEIKNGNLKLSDLVRISKRAWQAEGTRMFLEPNSKVSVEQLINGIIIQSGNDASRALAEHVAGSETSFVDLMNSYAELLGMENTHFMNVTGLPEAGHYTTAADIAKLAKALIRHFPKSYSLYSKKYYTYNGIKQNNRNRLLWRNDSVDGIKTGYASKAGYCIVASAKKQGMRLIAVVMGAKNDNIRTSEAHKLLTWGFRFFETNKRYEAGQSLKQISIWMGDQKSLDIGLAKDVYLTVERGYGTKITEKFELEDNIQAPISAGTVVGKIIFKLNNRVISEQSLIALDSIEEGGYFNKFVDIMRLSFQRLLEKISI